MAIVQNPITGRSSQKFGNAVFSTQFGKNTLRTKPISVKNPRTTKQMIVRKRMKLLVHLFRQIVTVVNTAYCGSVKGMSPFNRVISLNMKQAFQETDPLEITPASFVICDNDGLHPDSFVLTTPDPDKIHVEYTPHYHNAEEGALEMGFICLDPTVQRLFKTATTCTYSSTHVDIPLPGYPGHTIFLYCVTLDNVNLLNGEPRQIFTYCGTVNMPFPS
jgi:hypothetical protein